MSPNGREEPLDILVTGAPTLKMLSHWAKSSSLKGYFLLEVFIRKHNFSGFTHSLNHFLNINMDGSSALEHLVSYRTRFLGIVALTAFRRCSVSSGRNRGWLDQLSEESESLMIAVLTSSCSDSVYIWIFVMEPN